MTSAQPSCATFTPRRAGHAWACGGRGVAAWGEVEKRLKPLGLNLMALNIGPPKSAAEHHGYGRPLRVTLIK